MEIGLEFDTDKIRDHDYGAPYERHLQHLRESCFTLLEIGIGDGRSLAMWEEYFPQAKIFGVDLYPPLPPLRFSRSTILQGDQADPAFLTHVAEVAGGFDVVIDDGGHTMVQQKTSLGTLLPYVRPGGIYVIEDLETSYIPEFGGGAPTTPDTFVDTLKGLVDVTFDTAHKLLSDAPPIAEMHFYEQRICFLVRSHRAPLAR